MRLTFIGAAQEVTGSCLLVEADDVRFLVDCGMFQGGREARARNLKAWPFDPRQIDFVLLTHAHIDHSGLLPRLCALGFRGPILTTRATVDLLSVMLLDSAFIQESEWARAQRQRARQPWADAPALLYTVAQAQACLEQLQGTSYDEDVQPHASVRCRFRDAGHILGSAILEVWVSEMGRSRKLVFSGDLGQPGRPIVRDPTPIDSADVLVVESTYGNRLHRPLGETIDELVFVIEDTLRRRQGNIIIPAFALGRTQELLHLLLDLCRRGKYVLFPRPGGPVSTNACPAPAAVSRTKSRWNVSSGTSYPRGTKKSSGKGAGGAARRMVRTWSREIHPSGGGKFFRIAQFKATFLRFAMPSGVPCRCSRASTSCSSDSNPLSL